MSTTTTQSIRDQFMKVVASGDEKAAKAFLLDHLKEFSENVQTEIISAFFFDALEKDADEIEKRATLQKQALAAFADLEKSEKSLGDEKKKAEIKSKLGM